MSTEPETQYAAVNSHYGAYAQSAVNSTSESSSSSTSANVAQTIAKAFGYTEEELSSIPENANLGLGCGNPLALANLKEGETVVDLGSGGGFDVFLAAKKVGPSGKAIGIDMNKDMLTLAHRNLERSNLTNVTFLESAITSLPLPTSSADCILSNCVINLVPDSDKQLVFNEIFRVLKPGGRVAVSDILAKKELPAEIRSDLALVVGCIGGASEKGVYEAFLRGAGFKDILIRNTGTDVNIYKEDPGPAKPVEGEATSPAAGAGSCCKPKPTSCCGSTAKETSTTTAVDGNAYSKVGDLNEWVGSYQIYAIKPQE